VRRQPLADLRAHPHRPRPLDRPHVQIDRNRRNGRPGELKHRGKDDEKNRQPGPETVRPQIAQQAHRQVAVEGFGAFVFVFVVHGKSKDEG
jgi:hypothetical protein